MAKPAITKRVTKGSALTYAELDTNFQNIIDSILTVTDGVDDIDLELIDSLEVRGDHNIKVTVTPSGNIVTVDNEIPAYTLEPNGFENTTDSVLAFNSSTRVFSIAPTAAQFRFWVAGVEYTKTTSQTVTLPNVTALYLIVYDNTGTLQYKTGYLDFDAEAPVAHVYWNATTGAGRLAEQRHGIAMDWATHEYLHRTRGAAYASGLAISNYTTVGDGSSNSHAQFDLSGGTFFDEDLKFDITHSNSPTAPFAQDLQGPGRIPVAYHLGATGTWYFDTATDYAVKVGTIAKYNLNTAGTWTTPDITSTHYVAMWIVATNFISEPIVAIMGQRTDNKLDDAENNNTYASLDLTNFPSEEFRPLYRIIFRSATGYTNTPKAYIADVTDFRTVTVSGGASVALAPNSFGNIAVTGQDPIIAETVNDTLTLVAGTGITLTTDAATDSVTIASAGAGTVNTGLANRFAFYPSDGTTVDDSSLSITTSGSNITLKNEIIDGDRITLDCGSGGITSQIYADTSNIFLNLARVSTGMFANINLFNSNQGEVILEAGTAISLYSDAVVVGRGSSIDSVLRSPGASKLILRSGVSDGAITINSGANGNIELDPVGTGLVKVLSDLDLTTGVIGTSTTDSNIEIEPNGTGKTVIFNLVATETIVANGNTGAATLTPNAALGAVQSYTVTGNITFSAFGTPVAGQSITLILTQGGSGSYVLTSTMKFAGGSKTLSTAVGAVDIITVYYDGTNYWASLSKGFA